MNATIGFARLAAFEAAKRDLQASFQAKYQSLLADYSAELAELDRRYWAGEPLDGKPALKAVA